MRRFLLFSIVFLFSVLSYGQHRFIENKGQWNEKVQFKTEIGGGNLYLESGKLTFDRYDSEVVSKVFGAHRGEKPIPVPEKLDCHAYQMNFVGANEILPEGEKAYSTKYAYYLGNRSGKNVLAYQEVIYSELYDGIDLKIHSKSNLKYDFIIEAGGDHSHIQIRYDGVKPKLKADGTLELNTSVGKVLESKPFAYQIIEGLITRVACSYIISGDIVMFQLGEYAKDQELIIDPELIFSTYSGSFSNNFGYTATFDQEGHLYSGSSVFGNAYPVTTGAYQTEWAGGDGADTPTMDNPGTDIAISKFSLDGTELIYSTYLGGSADDLPHSLVTDSLGNLYVMGTTGSSDYPVTPGVIQSSFQGGSNLQPDGLGISYPNGSDIVISVLSESGQDLMASTYVGGAENDGINSAGALKYNYADEIRGEIELDDDGNILVGSSTFSPDFPVTSGSLQEEIGGNQDGVYFVLNPDMTSLFASTFVGGTGQDAIYSISFSNETGVTLGGGTSSGDLPIPSNAYEPIFIGGTADGFVLTSNEFATEILSGTYFGTADYDQTYFVDRDEDGFVYLFGQTESEDIDLFFNAEYGQEGTGMFISKLSQNLQSAEFSTTFGNEVGVPPISPVAFAVDLCNRVYLSGWGGETNSQGTTTGLDVTDDAFQTSTDGSDFYFLVLEDDANALTFASFYGGSISNEHVDGGTSRFDRTGKIYQAVCAGCGGNDDFPIAPANALSPVNNSSCNLGVAKIDFDLPLIFADFEGQGECLPNPITFENTSETFSGSEATYEWFFPNGEIIEDENVAYLFDEPGEYEVTLVANDPQACNLTDTITQTITVYSQLILEIPDTLISCDESTFDIQAVTNGTATSFTWAEDADLSNVILQGPSDSTLTLNVTEPTTVYLEVDNGLCTDLRAVFVAPQVDLDISVGDTLLCNTDTLQINLETNYPNAEIVWTPEESIATGQGSETALFSIDASLNIGVTLTNEFGCTNFAESDISSFDIALEVPQDTLACFNDPLTLVANSFGTAESFIWSDVSDFSNVLNPSADSAITVTPGATGQYFVQVENNGCTLDDVVVVSLLEAGTTLAALQYICQGDTARLFVSNDFPNNQLTHEWQPEELILAGNGSTAIAAIIDEPTTFTVTSSTQFGCSVENSLTIFTSPLGGLEVNAQAEPNILLIGESSQLSVSPDSSNYFYQWEPSTYLNNQNFNDPVSTPDETITYIVTLTDADDLGICQKSDSVTIQVFESFCGTPNIFVPNAFTPNGDGENDVLLVRGGGITDLTFSIFNRWGEEVFKTEDQSVGWDGTYKGNPSEPAVFVYQLQAICDDGDTYFEKGNITLIR
ncbi:MAG: gliding motility-associated C-terminal domain-containing protein [Cryomorphaceae bacterium]